MGEIAVAGVIDEQRNNGHHQQECGFVEKCVRLSRRYALHLRTLSADHALIPFETLGEDLPETK